MNSLPRLRSSWFFGFGALCCYGTLLVPLWWLLQLVLPFWCPDMAHVLFGALPFLDLSQGTSLFLTSAVTGIFSLLVGFSLDL